MSWRYGGDPEGAVVTVNFAVSTTSDGAFDVDCRWVKGDGEVLLLGDGNGLGGDFYDLECCHVEIAGESTRRPGTKARQAQKYECEGAVAGAEESLGVWVGRGSWWLWEECVASTLTHNSRRDWE